MDRMGVVVPLKIDVSLTLKREVRMKCPNCMFDSDFQKFNPKKHKDLSIDEVPLNFQCRPVIAILTCPACGSSFKRLAQSIKARRQ